MGIERGIDSRNTASEGNWSSSGRALPRPRAIATNSTVRALLRRRVAINQAGRQTVRPRPRVVLKLVPKMLRIVGIFFPRRIRVGNQGVPRERLDGKSVRRVKIEILLEAVGVEKIIAHPPCRQR